MENIVKTLLERLSFYSNDNANAGEYLTQHLDEVKDTDTLEDILLTILMQRQRWNDNGSNYNQDYRRRLIQWFTGNERLSPVLQAGVTKLMEYDSELFPASVIKLEKLENRQNTKICFYPGLYGKTEIETLADRSRSISGKKCGTDLSDGTEEKIPSIHGIPAVLSGADCGYCKIV